MGNWYTCMLLSTYGANKQSQRAVYQGACAHAEDHGYVLDWRFVLNITCTSLPGTRLSRTKKAEEEHTLHFRMFFLYLLQISPERFFH